MKVAGPGRVGDIARQIAFLAMFVGSASTARLDTSHSLAKERRSEFGAT